MARGAGDGSGAGKLNPSRESIESIDRFAVHFSRIVPRKTATSLNTFTSLPGPRMLYSTFPKPTPPVTTV